MMTRCLYRLADCPHYIRVAVSIRPLSLMVDPSAHHHTDTGAVLRVSRGPHIIVREGGGAVRVGPLVLTAMGEVCPHSDGEPLVGRLVGILHPVLPGLMNCQPTTKQSIILQYEKKYGNLLALKSMFSPAYALRNHEVPFALHPWGATLGSEGV